MSATVIAAVALGGALGAVMRFVVVTAWVRVAGTGFPYGTMTVNVVGSFAIGLIAGWLMLRAGEDAALRGFLITGMLGGFTTFSAFSLDVMGHIERQEWGLTLVYVVGSVTLSIAAAGAGLWLTRGAA